MRLQRARRRRFSRNYACESPPLNFAVFNLLDGRYPDENLPAEPAGRCFPAARESERGLLAFGDIPVKIGRREGNALCVLLPMMGHVAGGLHSKRRVMKRRRSGNDYREKGYINQAAPA